jgi:hypothetical protein
VEIGFLCSTYACLGELKKNMYLSKENHLC